MNVHQSSGPRISRHAIDRYRQRVERVEPAVAAQRLADLAASSTRRRTPRRWTEVAPSRGVVFLYPHAAPDICLVMRNNTIVTVFSQVICLERRSKRHTRQARPVRRPSFRRPPPGSRTEEAA